LERRKRFEKNNLKEALKEGKNVFGPSMKRP